MNKSSKFKLLIFLVISIVILIYFSLSIIQAQVKIEGKPDKPPGKNKHPCNNNGNCEGEEYNWRESQDSQPCDDCLPQNYGNLIINQDTLQIVTAFNGNQIYQYKYDPDPINNYNYRVSWASSVTPANGCATVIGDVDNDGQKEIITAVSYMVGERKRGRNKSNTYNHKIYIFEDEDGCPDGLPTWTSRELGELKDWIRQAVIEDVDNDRQKEIVMITWHDIIVYQINWDGLGYNLEPEYQDAFPKYDDTIFSLDVGDADNDSKNELVLAMFNIGAPIIWKYDDQNKKWIETIAEPINVLNPDISFLGIDVVKVRDVDNDPLNEIIAGGNNNTLMIWKWENDESKGKHAYKSKFISDFLEGFTQGVDAGDVDGDGQNEVVVATSGTTEGTNYLHIFKYIDGVYEIVNSLERNDMEFWVKVKDIDNDGKAEIVSSTQGITIYEYDDSGELKKTYNCAFAGINIDVN